MLFRPRSQGGARAANWRPLILLLCLSVELAACGGQPPTATPVTASGATPSTPPAAGTVNIDAANFKFAPAEITILAGTTVIWTNKDPAKHTITAANGSFDSGALDQGGTYSRTFDTPGTVAYYCKFHGAPGQGMSGTIHVVATAGGPTVPAAGPTAAPVHVDAASFKFAPAEITIPAGTTVIWTNKDPAKHTITAANGSFDSGALDQGGTYSRTFDTPGTVTYYCKFHGAPGQGMSGTIHVVAAAGASAPGAATPAAGVATATAAPAPSAPTPAPTAVAAATATLPAPTVAAGPPLPAPTATGAAAAAQPSGTVRFRDDRQLSDQVLVDLVGLPAPPAGKAYYAWLINSAGGAGANLGRVAVDAQGAAHLRYSDPAHANLLAAYDRVVVTAEDLEVVPAAPSAAVVLTGQLPPLALVHIRHLLVSFPAAPNRIGLEVGLRAQVQLVHDHAAYLRAAQAAGDRAGVRLHAEHLVNMIEGAKGADFGDLNKDGTVSNPGDGYGLLPNGDQLGYVLGTHDHAVLAATAGDATDAIKLQAGHIEATVANTQGWVTTIRDHALAILAAPDLQATAPLVQEIVTLADHASAGVDLQGNGVIVPVPGGGGAASSYAEAQAMAAFRLAPRAGATPVYAPTPPTP